MPLIFKRKTEVLNLGIWKCVETEEELLKDLLLSESEIQELSYLKGGRRKEWIGARRLLDTIVDPFERKPILKDENGKPHFHSDSRGISISHSAPLISAGISEVDFGLDIQKEVDKIYRIKHKYCSAQELRYNDGCIESLHVIWGAKESLFKAWGRKQMNFIKHLTIDPFRYDSDGGSFTAQINKNGEHWKFQGKYEKLPNHYLVYVLRSDDVLSIREEK